MQLIGRMIINTLQSHRLPAYSQEVIIEKKIKLLIIDSIASLIRKEFEFRSSSRSSILLQQASALKDIAEGFDIAVSNSYMMDIASCR